MEDGNRKLNIAMICDPIGDYKAGALVSALRFGTLLEKRGHHVIFIGARSKENKVNDVYGEMEVYRFRSIPIPRSGGWHLAFPTVSELKKIFLDEKIDVIHVVLPMSAAIVAVFAARALKIKIVAHSHSQPENLFMDVPKFLGRHILYQAWNKYLAWLYGKAESIVYPSRMGFEILHHLTKDGKPSVVISNGVNTEVYKPVEISDFHARFNIPKDTINIVYVGRLFPEKSVDTLIKAVPIIIKEYPKSHVIIVGIGYLKPKLETLADSLGVSKNVTFLTLNDADKILAYNAGDIFISPSFAELEGMTVLEAMACGKPIIVPNAKMNASRFFVDDNGFLFETTNHRDLAEKALLLIKDENLRDKMGARSLAKSKKYDINQSVTQLEELYKSLLT
jgi:glycosyltransferase involved in cell wall biosynthesis